ncbi:nucleotide triphosphate diphosphatase NUDT15 [Anaerosporobacter faecicola]|uniref:nucleotide triphosphate diphosphatase NUDT15 n=1 Tax=Anaerosporobacter faecicola TaxID=2718714 RepID=UPI00143A9067|nr:NUDIX domain-containing protein [Anaerosporobacter faecicola]
MDQIIKVGIGVMLIDDNKILLGHRTVNGKDTGGIYEPDHWCLPGGKQEYEETVFEGAMREVKEETNLAISDLAIFNVADDIQPNKHFVTIQIVAKKFEGNLTVMEPDKQDEWRWFPLNELPQKIYSPSKKFIDLYREKMNIPC